MTNEEAIKTLSEQLEKLKEAKSENPIHRLESLGALVIWGGICAIALYVASIMYVPQLSYLPSAISGLWIFFAALWAIDKATPNIHFEEHFKNPYVFIALLISLALVLFASISKA